MAKIRNKQPDADAGRVIVDEQLEDLEARLTSMYAQTAKEVQSDLDKFLSKYKAEDAKKQAMVEADEMTKDEYIDWRNRQIFRSNAMRAKIDDVTARMVNTDKQAMSMVNDQLPETYATSYNFGGYRAEAMSHEAGFDYTQFTIINQDAVKELMTKDPDLIPWKADPDVEEDKRWNRQHIQEAVRQGIVKGDSMDDIAKRLLPIVNMDKNAAIRTARTAVNGIENKGRKDATERVKAAGIPMIEMWSCTHDNRTRDTHILLDKTLPNEKGLFGEGILTTLLEYPGDPSGDPAEVYNCRCGLMSTIKGIDHSKDDELYAKMMQEEYYDDWLQVKEKQDEKEAAFQTKKEGAAERVAEKRAREEAKNVDTLGEKTTLTKEEAEKEEISEQEKIINQASEVRDLINKAIEDGKYEDAQKLFMENSELFTKENEAKEQLKVKEQEEYTRRLHEEGQITREEFFDGLPSEWLSQMYDEDRTVRETISAKLGNWSAEGYQTMKNDYLLEQAIQKNSRQIDTTLYRGISLKSEIVDNLTTGAKFEQNGLSSWSTDQISALEFAHINETPVLIVDRSQKQIAVPIADFSSHSYENEVLSSGSNEFEVISKKTETMEYKDRNNKFHKREVIIIEVKAK